MTKKIGLPEVGKVLLGAERIAITAHLSPDGDALGSSLGLAGVLTKLGKDVTIFVDDIIKGFKFLPEVASVKLDKDLDAIDTENFDLLCVLDCSTLARIGRVKDKIKAPVTLNIDHHISNEGFTDYAYIDGYAAATAEIIVDLVREMQWPLDERTATCLYMGLVTDSGSFSFSCTRGATLRNGAFLVEHGAQPSLIHDGLDDMEWRSIKALRDALETMTFAFDGKVAYMYTDLEHYDPLADMDSFSSYPRRIIGVEIAFYLKEVEPGLTRASIRSRSHDVSKLALVFHGGGHAKASGCTIHLPLQQALEAILSEIGKLYF